MTRQISAIALLVAIATGCAPTVGRDDAGGETGPHEQGGSTGASDDASESTGEDLSGTGYEEASTGRWNPPEPSEGSSSSTGSDADGSTGGEPSCEAICSPGWPAATTEDLEACECACDFLCVATSTAGTESFPATLACGLQGKVQGGAHTIECQSVSDCFFLGPGTETCEDYCDQQGLKGVETLLYLTVNGCPGLDDPQWEAYPANEEGLTGTVRCVCQ